MEELIGQQLGTYTIERLLGRGGMAAVFLANDATMDRQVAVKVLPREFSYDQVYVERFKREVKTIAKLAHPNIVPVHAFGEQDGWTYIVMTYLPGGTLHARIKQKGGSIPLETVVNYMDQIASAVDYAHSSGIIHRDFKPANVLIGERGHLALSDFGIAKMAEGTSQLTGTAMLGTPAYMAPEMANEGGLTKLVDVYSVGATLYELLTGRVPFNADTPMGMLLAHVSSPVPDVRERRDDLPDAVQDVIEQAMAKDPTQRCQSAGEIAAGLRDALGMPPAVDSAAELSEDDGSTIATPRPRTPQPTKARPLTGGARTVESTRPNLPIPLIGLAVAVIAVIVIGALALSGVLAPPTASLPSEPPDGEPTDVVGPTLAPLEPVARVMLGAVDFKLADSDFQPLAGSTPLAAGTSIRTGADGVAVFSFADGVGVEIQPGTLVSIQRLEIVGDTLFVELTQDSGTTFHFLSQSAAGLKRSYQVHTPRGTIMATGTQFWVNEAAEGWYYIPAEGSTNFDLNDTHAPDDQYVEHASRGDCILVDADSNVSDCQKQPTLTLMTDASGTLATITPTAAVFYQPPTATSCSEQYYCSKDPNMKGTLVHEKADCTIELLPGNPQCAGDLGGGRPTAAPGCVPVACSSGSVFCWQAGLCNGGYDVVWQCESWDGCNVCGTCSSCGSQCTP